MKQGDEQLFNVTPTVTSQYRPKFIPVKCPKCSGFGSVNYGKFICTACEGTGIYKIPLDDEGEDHEHNKR